MISVFGLLVAGAASAAGLERVLEDVVAEEALRGASVSLLVRAPDGRERAAIDADRRLVPASITKWVTAAAAAETLPLDHVFETRIGATGYTDGAVLVGDLVLTGGGDPSLGDPDPRGVVARIVQTVRDGGVERITGTVVVDDSAFDGPAFGPGWMWDDLSSAYSAPYGAVNFGHNVLVDGVPCPAQDGPGTPLLDPALCLATAVHDGLVASGIPVEGGVAIRAAPEATPLAVLASPPLRELIRKMLVESDNLYAECILRALDRVGPGEDRVARDRVTAVLKAAGVERGVKLVDGSGLSRYSLVSAEAMVDVTAWVQTRPWGEDLLGLLPVAGRDGTLQGRMVGTPAEGRARAKTGSMTGVRNIVGTVRNAAGEELVFAMLVNGLLVPPSEAIAVQDRVVALVAASKGRRVPRRSVAALVPADG